MIRSPFEFLADELKRASVPHMLVGGHAVNQYRISRNTVDIDVAVQNDDLPGVLSIVKALGYEESMRFPSFVRVRHRDLLFPDIDFMLLDSQTFSKLMAEAVPVEIQKRLYYVPSLLHLIAMKLHAIKNNPRRELQDLDDIVWMCVQNGVNVDDKEFEETCRRFAGPEWYEKIRNQVRSRRHEGP